MKERGIPFMADMVRAVQADRKNQTRRICKLPHQNPLGQWEPTTFGGPNGGRTSKGETVPEHAAIWHTRTGDCIAAPYIVGDRLWGREHYRVSKKHDDIPPRDIPERSCTVFFEAGGSIANQANGRWEENRSYSAKDAGDWVGKFRPGMFMCRWMSRILLEVVSVRVERLQDISEADAKAEGCDPMVVLPEWSAQDLALIDLPLAEVNNPYRNGYAILWNAINGAGSWDLNPWVWVVVFKRITP